jgi:integrase
MARVFKRGGVWWMAYQRNGRRTRKSLKVSAEAITKSDARDLMLEDMHKERHAEAYGREPEAVPFARFADDWLDRDSPDKKSKGRDADIVAMLKVAWKGQDLHTVTTEMVEGYKAKRRKYRAPATVNKEIQVIKRLFKKAHAWGRIAANPAATVEKLRANNTRVRFLEADEMMRLEEKLPEWLQPIVTFARFTGARRGEILKLTWNDVDMKRELLTFKDTKNGETGHVEINQTVRTLLESLPSPMSRSQRVFQPVKIEKLRKAWLTACRRARIGQECGCSKETADGKPRKGCAACGGSGIDVDFRFHDLRHQAATDLLTLGADLNDVRDFLRHKSMAMTLRYAHLVKARRTRTARLLDAIAPSLEGVQKRPQSDRPSA